MQTATLEDLVNTYRSRYTENHYFPLSQSNASVFLLKAAVMNPTAKISLRCNIKGVSSMVFNVQLH